MSSQKLKIEILKGAPASGKTSYARQIMQSHPGTYKHINNDGLRKTLDFSFFSKDNEKLVKKTRDFLIKEAILANFNAIVDNVNGSKDHFNEVVKSVEDLKYKIKSDVEIIEIPFYQPLEVLLERDAQRQGIAKVGTEVVKSFFNKLGGKGFEHYQPRSQVISPVIYPKYFPNESLPAAFIVDIDGTIANIDHRSPYDTAKCSDDTPNKYVVRLVKLLYNDGYDIIFCSGREDQYRDLTEQWLDQFDIRYQLYMRSTGNFEKDAVVKENIYNTYIKDKYHVCGVFDDRLQVCRLWYYLNLPLFRFGNPDSSF